MQLFITAFQSLQLPPAVQHRLGTGRLLERQPGRLLTRHKACSDRRAGATWLQSSRSG
ncbi:MAG TPA: hypothetical protein VH593_20135 [Ktedonobacteraceae bacterium]